MGCRKLSVVVSVLSKRKKTIAETELNIDEKDKLFAVQFSVSAKETPAVVNLKLSSTSLLGVTVSTCLSKQISADEMADEMNISVEDLSVLLEAFKKHTSSRMMTFKEYQKAIAEVQEITFKSIFSEDYAEVTFSLFDANHDNQIDAYEFLAGVSIFANGSVEEKATLAFRALDKNGDGLLSKNELTSQMNKMRKVSKKILSNASKQHFGLVGQIAQGVTRPKIQGITEEDIKALFQDCDADHDGKLSLDEWVKGATTNPIVRRFMDPFPTSATGVFAVEEEDD